jgi:hypothetical protein
MRNHYYDGGFFPAVRWTGRRARSCSRTSDEMARPVVQYYDNHGTVDETPKRPVPVRITTAPQARCRIRLFTCWRLQGAYISGDKLAV